MVEKQEIDVTPILNLKFKKPANFPKNNLEIKLKQNKYFSLCRNLKNTTFNNIKKRTPFIDFPKIFCKYSKLEQWDLIYRVTEVHEEL